MGLVFIAVPTKGVVTDGKLNVSFIRFVAQLHRVFPDLTFAVPMIQDYALLPYLEGIDATWEVWGQHCDRLIKVCDEVWVIHYDGWAESTGVKAEIALAAKYGKKLYHFLPELNDVRAERS